MLEAEVEFANSVFGSCKELSCIVVLYGYQVTVTSENQEVKGRCR